MSYVKDTRAQPAASDHRTVAAPRTHMDVVLGRLDARISIKHIWRRLQLLARVLIVSTFIDDAIRVASDYTGQADSMRTVGFGDPLSALMPIGFVLVQTAGALLVLTDRSPLAEAGCVLLAVWTAAHPFLYAQHSNAEFVVESVSIIGGLLILLSNRRALARSMHSGGGTEPATDQLQLAGRACLSALYVFYAQKMARHRLTDGAEEAPGEALVEGVLLAGLLGLTGLIVIGLRSRWCALVLALITACTALYSHPWYAVLWSSRDTYTLEDVVGYEGTQVPAWVYATHQRYFFFQQLSTAGALLQLVVHGPGKYSVDEADGPLQVVTMVAKSTAKGVE
jgi:uncharacterized membrane protein YphA (DoxX/SURF4 family)